MGNRILTVSELKDRFVNDFKRKHYPHMTEYYFGGKFPESELDKNLQVWREWSSQVDFLYYEGYDPHKFRNQKPVLPVFSESGRSFGRDKIDDAWTDGLLLYIDRNDFFDLRHNLMVESDAVIHFPYYEWKENWFAKDVGFSEGWCIWDRSGVLTEFFGKALWFFIPYKVGKDGVVEVEGILYPMEWNEELEDMGVDVNLTSYGIIYLYSKIHEYLMFNRFQLLFYTGKISREEFVKAYEHFGLCFSLFRPQAPVYIGKKAFELLVTNVIVPANEQLKESGTAVIELEDFRDFGLIREKNNWKDMTEVRFPLRVRIWDWEKTKVLPLPTRAVVWSEEVLPLPEEVEALCLDLALHEQWIVEEVEAEMKQGKKLSPGRLNVYEQSKSMLRTYRKLPEWYRELYEEKWLK